CPVGATGVNLPSLFLFECHCEHRDLHYFPTRRSSDHRCNQGYAQGDVVARHDHLGSFWQFTGTGYVGGAEVELRTVAFEVGRVRSEEHTSELQSRENLVCRLLLE